MATSGTNTPFMGSVTATTSAATLFSLLSAVRTGLAVRACYVSIQLDPGAGSGTLQVGFSDVSSANCGYSLLAGQAPAILAFDSNMIDLKQIFLLGSTSVQVNLIVVTR